MSGKPHVQGLGFALRRLIAAVCIAVLALFSLLVVTAQAQMVSPSLELCLGAQTDGSSSDGSATMPCCPDGLAQTQRGLGGDLVLHVAPVQPGLALPMPPIEGYALTLDNRPGGPVASWYRGVAAPRPPPALI
jgi:hypothetical protein